ncbi:MAG: DNA polymerase III subunit delta [Allomuricauda sp.]|nr:MAG: DNA polymerase III subunit delta [Allomuricauda sp.]
MEGVKEIAKSISEGQYKPIYFLMGDEPYYIDKITEHIANSVLSEEERGFNQMTLYGKETNIDEIVGNAKRYPMMADYQVVVVKEAQHLSRTIENLEPYANQPQPTTILVLCYKYKKLDKRKKLYKSIQKNGQLFESKKLYENQVSDWIRKLLQGKGKKILPKASAMLVEYLGTDLSKISNELDKLALVVADDAEISPQIIEQYIGISKDYNNFELKKAIGERDLSKASRIINYFSQNPKDNPFVVTITLINTFFTQLLQYHGLSDHSPKNVSRVLGINPYFVGEFQIAAKNYSMKQISQILSDLRELDLKSKGLGASNMSQSDLLKELFAKVF